MGDGLLSGGASTASQHTTLHDAADVAATEADADDLARRSAAAVDAVTDGVADAAAAATAEVADAHQGAARASVASASHTERLLAASLEKK